MARVTPQEYLTKWGTNLNAAGVYIKSGVNKVSVAPGVSAAAASDRMLAGVTQAIQTGTWQRAVSGVSLQSWQDAMINKGIPRLPTGIATAQKTKVDRITTLLSNVDAAAATANALPRGGLQQGIARATAFMTDMSARSAASKGR
jgi:hypothetical protein